MPLTSTLGCGYSGALAVSARVDTTGGIWEHSALHTMLVGYLTVHSNTNLFNGVNFRDAPIVLLNRDHIV